MDNRATSYEIMGLTIPQPRDSSENTGTNERVNVPAHFRVDPAIFFDIVRDIDTGEATTGADVLVALLEENDSIPSAQYAHQKTEYANALVALQEQLQKNPKLAQTIRFKEKLEDLNVFGSTITDEMVQNASHEAVVVTSTRNSIIDTIRSAQRTFDIEFQKEDSTGKRKMDIDKIVDLYEKTDAFVADDELLTFAHNLRSYAHNERQTQTTLAFERLVRFMFVLSQDESEL